jgi:hypothetical protein
VSALIRVLVAITVLGAVLAVLYLLPAPASRTRLGPARAREGYGEYGRLEARLKDLRNPYSGLPLFSREYPAVAIAFVTVLFLSGLAGTIAYERAGTHGAAFLAGASTRV